MKKLIFVPFVALLLLTGCLGSEEPGDYVSFEEQLEIDIALIKEYLDGRNLFAEEDGTGIFYVTGVTGTGATPTSLDSVSVNYKASLLGGSEIDAGQNAKFMVRDLIPAWQITLSWMKVGGSIKIFAPSGYCYGRLGANGVPPNTNMEFDITLTKVIPHELK